MITTVMAILSFCSDICLCVGLGLFMLAGSIINFVSGSKEVGFALAFCAFMLIALGVGKDRCFVIKTKQKNITWSVHARFFYEAERVALDRYPDEKEYGKKK